MLEETLGIPIAMGRGRSAPISRWKASSVHLLISLSIGAAVLLLMLFVWFPQPYLQAAGGGELFSILVGVDVVLGPLVTLIVFDTKKKYLKLDLAVIAILQFAALGYGLSVILQARPVYVVFAVDRLELVLASDIAPEELARDADLEDFPQRYLRYEDRKERARGKTHPLSELKKAES